MIKLDVPYIDQSVKYPTGCESVTAVMLLNYLGYTITVDEFIEEYLELQGFSEKGGQLFGPNPNEFFCGSPYDSESFGCYAPVLTKALSKAAGDSYEVKDETGKDIDFLLRQYIDKGMPVIFWACINMREPIEGPCWKLHETGEEFTWISNEHCMLLVGYDETGYFFNDPYENNGVVHYEKDLTKNRHAAQHAMAVGLQKIHM